MLFNDGFMLRLIYPGILSSLWDFSVCSHPILCSNVPSNLKLPPPPNPANRTNFSLPENESVSEYSVNGEEVFRPSDNENSPDIENLFWNEIEIDLDDLSKKTFPSFPISAR